MTFVITFENSHVRYVPDTSKHNLIGSNTLKFTIRDYIGKATKDLGFILTERSCIYFHGRRFRFDDKVFLRHPSVDKQTTIHIKRYLTGLTEIMKSNNMSKAKMVRRWVQNRHSGFSVSCGHPCPLRIAVELGDLDMLNFLLDYGADPNRFGSSSNRTDGRGGEGSILFDAASSRNRLDHVQSLFISGARVEWEEKENNHLKKKLIMTASLKALVALTKIGLITSRNCGGVDPLKLEQITRWERKRENAILKFLEDLVGSPHVVTIILDYETFIGYNHVDVHFVD